MNAVDFLGLLTETWPQAAETVLTMSKNSKAHVRFNAICCLKPGTTQTVVNTVLKSGLADKSSRVRWKAAEKTEQLEMVNLLPELTARS
jgi:hypothetical protein